MKEKTLFYAARHGTTDDTKKNIFRGNRDSALDRKGFLDAHEQKDFFSKHPWKYIFISPMTRSAQTAKIIAGDRQKDISTPIPEMEPWRIGYLTGKDKKEYEPDMEIFVENPDMRPQDGETLAEFRARIVPLYLEAIEMGLRGAPSIIIGHSSTIHVLTDMLKNDDGGKQFAVKPGGIIEVFIGKNGEIQARAVLKEGEDDSNFAGAQPSS